MVKLYGNHKTLILSHQQKRPLLRLFCIKSLVKNILSVCRILLWFALLNGSEDIAKSARPNWFEFAQTLCPRLERIHEKGI